MGQESRGMHLHGRDTPCALHPLSFTAICHLLSLGGSEKIRVVEWIGDDFV